MLPLLAAPYKPREAIAKDRDRLRIPTTEIPGDIDSPVLVDQIAVRFGDAGQVVFFKHLPNPRRVTRIHLVNSEHQPNR